jgi:hypothetical protein
MLQALVRMADVEQASWALQNLHLTTPENAPQPILVRFADSPEDKVVASHMVESGVHIFQSPHMLEGSMDILNANCIRREFFFLLCSLFCLCC